jgi:electron transport complex protein RnfC
MRERASDVVAGSRIMRETVGADRLVIGVEDNKPEALAALREVAEEGIEVLALPTSYPQGAEKQLIYSVTAAEVPHGKLPAATGCLVHNVGTAAAMADAIERQKPLIERVVTVTGAVVRPGNYLTVIGTPLESLIEAAGGLTSEATRVIAGGPMTGMGVANLAAPVVKGTSGVVALPHDEVPPAVTGDQPCIRCGRCADACPMMLQPFSLGIQANAEQWDRAEEGHVLDCIECGCCSYSCPTRRPLIQLLRRAKQVLLERGAKL